MPVSLAQAKLNTTDDVDAFVIDEFRKSSAILDALPFHDAVSGMGNGSTLTYAYQRVTAQRGAAFRAINSEYTPAEATKARYSVDLKPLGGSFEIDRVLAQIARGSEVAFQLEQLIKATATKFADEVINGDTGVDANGFDGLDKALTGTTTEYGSVDSPLDLTDLDTAGKASQALDALDAFIGLLDGPPTMILGNQYALAKVRAIARRSEMYVSSPVEGLFNSSGQPIMRQQFGNAILVDPGDKAGSTQPIIPVYDPDNSVWTVANPDGADGGTFKLEIKVDDGAWQETAAIAYNANIATAELAIEALSGVGAGNGTVSGSAGAWVITFSGDLAGEDVSVRVSDQSVTDGGVAEDVTVTESANVGGLTDLYAVRIGMDGFHGVSAAGQPLVSTWLPDFTVAGAVKKGEVEMGPVAAVLKATKAAAVYRGIKVR